MATEKLEIVVGADVQDVVKKLDQIEKTATAAMGKTATSFEPVKTALKTVQVEAFDTDKAFREAMERISNTVDKNVDNILNGTDRLKRGIKTTQEQFQAFGGLKKFIPPEIPERFQRFAKAANQASQELPKLAKNTVNTSQTLINFGRVVQDAPFGIIGIANNIDPLISSFTALRTSTGTTGAALRALFSSLAGPAGIAVAISTVTSALIFFTQNQQKAKKEVKEASEETQNFNAVLSQSVKSVVDEAGKVQSLVTALSTLTLSRKEQAKLISELQILAPEYFGTLTRENDLINQLANSYFIYKNSISKAIQAKLIEADVNRVTKQLEEVEKIFKRFGDQESIREIVGGKPTERRGTFTLESGEQLDINLLLQRRSTLQSVILGFQKQINSSNDDYITKLLAGNKLLKETKKDIDESKAAVDGILSGYLANNTALQEQVRLQELLNDLQRRNNELRTGGQRPPTLGLTPTQQLNLAGDDSQLGTAIENIETIKKKFLEVNDVINNGINAGIDQFFNAIANNQDPFEALAQSVKRLVAELAAAVVKALILKAISNAIAPGAGGALSGIFSSASVIRGDQLRTLTFLRG